MRFLLLKLQPRALLKRQLILALLLSSNVYADDYNYPGGVIDIRLTKENSELPEVKYGLKEPTIIERKDHWQVLIGIDLNTLPGEYLVYVKQTTPDASAFSQTFKVQQPPARAPTQIDSSALATELKYDKMSILSYANTQQPSLPLRYPADGQWADYFGDSAITQKSNKTIQQNYISLTTTELSPVVAPQNGIVSRIEPFPPGTDGITEQPLFSIFLDHGRGLYSVISGVTNLSVETGNGVVAGAVLGMLPANTQVDGNTNNQPNKLIWQCVLNGVYVNPTILTQLK